MVLFACVAIALAACSKDDKAAPGDANRMFVVEQAGTVRVLANSDSATASTVFINISTP